MLCRLGIIDEMVSGDLVTEIKAPEVIRDRVFTIAWGNVRCRKIGHAGV
jgi:hypothetical protein